MEKNREKTLGVPPERHKRLKVIAAKHGFRKLFEALERFGGPGIDAEYERLERGGTVAPCEAAGKE